MGWPPLNDSLAIVLRPEPHPDQRKSNQKAPIANRHRAHRRPDARLATPRIQPPGDPKRRGFDGGITKSRLYAVGGGVACY